MGDILGNIEHSGPERLWTGAYGNTVTASARLAGELTALGDTLVEYVRADLHQGAVSAERERIAALVRRKGIRAGGNAALTELADYIANGGQ